MAIPFTNLLLRPCQWRPMSSWCCCCSWCRWWWSHVWPLCKTLHTAQWTARWERTRQERWNHQKVTITDPIPFHSRKITFLIKHMVTHHTLAFLNVRYHEVSRHDTPLSMHILYLCSFNTDISHLDVNYTCCDRWALIKHLQCHLHVFIY